VPGETLTSFGQQRDVKSRVLAQSASARCSSPKLMDTEVRELHNDGKVAAKRGAWTRAATACTIGSPFDAAARDQASRSGRISET
jgi:hypothetical protein